MKRILLILVALVALTDVFGQTRMISGSVKAESSEPLVGVAVTIKGSTAGTVSDIDGCWSIRATRGDVLCFSCLGMVDKTVVVKSDHIDVVMSQDTYFVDDVVVIGYGTSKKSDLTGSVASIKTSELKNTKVGMASNALQGLAAGVQVTAGNLKPGADAGIVIRGAGSVNAGTSPLYVVDGVPVSGLQDISTSDIQSIEVLKDASSAAIYGSRGSNGVVLITTRRGDKDQGRITFNVVAGAQKMLNKQDMMNAQQYYDLVSKSGQSYTWTTEELLLLSRGESTDWQDAVTQVGSFQNYNLSVSGGSDKLTHFLGVDWYDQRGIIKNSSFDKITVRYNADAVLKPWLR